MAAYKDRAALDKVVRARTNLLISNGFFGFLAMQLKIIEVTEEMNETIYKSRPITTMAVDGVNLYYYPKFVHGITERQLEAVVAHECEHCCFQHFSRRGSRDPFAWNAAGDFVINLDLTEAGFDLPYKQSYTVQPGSKEKVHLYDPKYKGMTTEEIYDTFPTITVNMYSAGDGDPGGMGGVLDAPGGQGGADEAQRAWETSVRQAIAVAKANNAGHIPGSLRRLMDNLEKPKVSWRDKTRNFIDQSLSKDVSWARPNRRSIATGALMPGYISDRLNHLVFAVDTSGSIDMKLLTEFLSEVAGALDENTADQLTVVYADTRVHDVEHFVPGDLVVAHELPNGGGGTDFRDTFKWIKDNVPDASCVIYLTDLQVSEFGEDPGCPMLWAVYAYDAHFDQLAARAPFGIPIQVSNMYG